MVGKSHVHGKEILNRTMSDDQRQKMQEKLWKRNVCSRALGYIRPHGGTCACNGKHVAWHGDPVSLGQLQSTQRACPRTAEVLHRIHVTETSSDSLHNRISSHGYVTFST